MRSRSWKPGKRALAVMGIFLFCPMRAAIAAATFPTNTSDLYRTYAYRLVLDGRTVAGFRGMKPAGRDARLPGRSKYEVITLERGVSSDSQFKQWANSAEQGTRNSRPLSFRDILVLQVYDAAGQLRKSSLLEGWISHSSGLPKLGRSANETAIEELELTVEPLTRGK